MSSLPSHAHDGAERVIAMPGIGDHDGRNAHDAWAIHSNGVLKARLFYALAARVG
jgi:hypothetical protein